MSADQSGAIQSVPEASDMTVRLGPLCLRHPIINGSGTMEIFDLADVLGPEMLERPPVAAYVPKTVLLAPREGNPSPRIQETPSGMINAIGLCGEGFGAFVTRDLPRLLALPVPVIVSIGGFSRQEYVSLAIKLKEVLESLRADWLERVGLELNISCPNVRSGCATIGTDPRETGSLVESVREVWPGLLIVKLTPNVTDITAVARASVLSGTDAIAAVNTYKGMVMDRQTLTPYLGNVTGGVSGPAIKPLALRAVYELFASVEVPIIGMGGVATVEDVLDFLACGARVVAVGCATFGDPWLIRSLANGLREELDSRNLRLSDVVGRAHST